MPRCFALLFFSLIVPCGWTQEMMKEITAPPVNKVKSSEVSVISEQQSELAKDGGYLANPSVVDCFAEMSYKYTGGRYTDETIRFRFRSPDKIEQEKKYPLVIWMHGSGESGNDNKRQLSHMQSTMEFLAGSNKLDFYLLATQCPSDNRSWDHSISDEGKGDAPLTILQEILDQILENYPIDESKISIVGVCSGGAGAWSLLRARPNVFSAITVFSASPPIGLNWDEHCSRTSLWAFNNVNDTIAPAEPMDEFVKRVNNTGGRAWITKRDGEHNSWTAAMRNDKIVAWLVFQNREKSSPPPGIVLYPHRSILTPILLFALPILLSVPLLLLRIVRYCSYKN